MRERKREKERERKEESERGREAKEGAKTDITIADSVAGKSPVQKETTFTIKKEPCRLKARRGLCIKSSRQQKETVGSKRPAGRKRKQEPRAPPHLAYTQEIEFGLLTVYHANVSRQGPAK